MPTWKKVIVSGSQAQLAAVTASSGLVVGTNQYIGTTQATTYLTGSFTGSFTGNGAGLTGVTATAIFPTNATTNLATTDQIYINDGANKYITYGNLVIDLAGSGAGTSNLTTTDTGDSLALTSQISITGASGSFSGSFFGNGSGLTAIPYTSLTSVPSGIVSASVLSSPGQGQALLTTNGVAGSTIDLGLETGDSPTFAGLTISTNALAVNNTNGITTTQTTFPIVTSTATTINLGTTGATTVNIGNGSSTVTVGNNLTVPGNLTVNGTTTIINTTNTAIKDQFILLASGSTGAMDGGIIVGDSATLNIGEALYWENNPGTTGRWAIQSGVDATSTTVTANSYLVTVSGSSASPAGAPTYGGATNGIGNMYIDTSLTAATDNNIWIYA